MCHAQVPLRCLTIAADGYRWSLSVASWGPVPTSKHLLLLLCANTYYVLASIFLSLSRPEYRWTRARVTPLPEQRHHQLYINMRPV